jgi:hypothetical protein
MRARVIPARGQSPVFTPSEAAEYLRIVSEPTLATWRHRPPRHGAPKFIKAGGKIGYLQEDLDEWLRRMRRVTTSDKPKP